MTTIKSKINVLFDVEKHLDTEGIARKIHASLDDMGTKPDFYGLGLL